MKMVDHVTIYGREYTRKAFEDAKVAGIERWSRRVQGKEVKGACSFCVLFESNHNICPVWDEKERCCVEFGKWVRATGDGRKEANDVLKRIISLDFDTWAAKYVEPKWEPKLYDAVQWDGVIVSRDGDAIDRIKAGIYNLDVTPENCTANRVSQYRCGGTGYWTTIEHLSPLPDKAEPSKPRVTLTKKQAEAVKEAWMKAIKLPGVMPDDSMVSKAIDSLVAPKPVKPEPQWSVGDWAFSITHNCPVRLDEPYTALFGPAWKVNINKGPTDNKVCECDLRPLTDADWTGEIAGVSVRAYADEDGDIRLLTPDTPGIGLLTGGQKVARAICTALAIPVMPYELSQGEYKKPEASDGK